ncbi:MAG: tetratricopeptide repeat protein [Hyphomicrobium sp.]
MSSDCFHADPDRQIRGCTSIIERGNRESRKNRAIAYNNRGNAYEQKGEHDRAIADFTKAIKIKPRYAAAYNNRAWTYFRRGEPDLGLPDAERAVELLPDNAVYLDTRGQIYAALGRREEAIADLKRALEIDPSLDETQAALEALAPSTNKGGCKRYFPSVSMTLTVPCE